MNANQRSVRCHWAIILQGQNLGYRLSPFAASFGNLWRRWPGTLVGPKQFGHSRPGGMALPSPDLFRGYAMFAFKNEAMVPPARRSALNFHLSAAAGRALHSLTFVPDGSSIALGVDEDVLIWDFFNGRIICKLPVPAVRAFHFHKILPICGTAYLAGEDQFHSPYSCPRPACCQEPPIDLVLLQGWTAML